MYRRRAIDAILLLVGAVVLLVTGWMASEARVPALERAVFHAVNDLPDQLYPLVWPLMQYGTFITIPLVAVAGLIAKQWRFAIVSLVTGVGIYFLAKEVKLIVDRGRPGAELDGVLELRGIGRLGYGFPSGHAAVSAALAVIAYAYLPPFWYRLSIALAVVVSFGRIYVGAHLPLDVVGGAALGIVAASAVNLLLGVPIGRRPADAPTGS